MLEKLLAAIIALTEALNAHTAALGGTAAPEAETTEEAAPEPPKKGKGKKAAPKPATMEEVRTAMLALNEAKGKQAVVDLLAQYGVGKIGDLDAANYAEVIKDANEAAAAEATEEEAETDVFG